MSGQFLILPEVHDHLAVLFCHFIIFILLQKQLEPSP